MSKIELTSILENIIEFENTSLKIPLKNTSLLEYFSQKDVENNEEKMAEYICKHLKIKEGNYRYLNEKSVLYISNSEDNIAFVKNYLQKKKYFEDLLDLFQNQNFTENMKYINGEGIHTISEVEENLVVFTSILQNNILNTQGIDEEKLEIPPHLFGRIREIDNHTLSFKFLANLFSLFAIAEKTNIKRTDDNDVFNFVITGNDQQNVGLEVEWPDFKNETSIKENNTKIEFFFDCYKWIVDSNKDISIEILLNVVRSYIHRTEHFSLNDDWESGVNTIMDQIIQGEADRYFNHVLKLRDEYKYLTDMKFDLRQKIAQHALTSLTTIALGFFGKIFAETILTNGNFKMNSLLDSDPFFAALFFYGVIALRISLYLLNEEYEQILEYYNQIKEIFINKFLFKEEEFIKIVGKIDNDPLINKYKNILKYSTFFSCVMGILFLVNWKSLYNSITNLLKYILLLLSRLGNYYS